MRKREGGREGGEREREIEREEGREGRIKCAHAQKRIALHNLFRTKLNHALYKQLFCTILLQWWSSNTSFNIATIHCCCMASCT